MKQTGLTLLEVLIALLVLAIGMAGLGALLLTALSNVHSASHFSLASAIALDFEERLWQQIALESSNGGDDLDPNGCLTGDQIAAVRAVLADQWAAASTNENWQWSNADRFQSPGLELVVDDPVIIIGQNDGENTGINLQRLPVTIQWTEARFGLADNTEAYTVTVALVCRPVFNGS